MMIAASTAIWMRITASDTTAWGPEAQPNRESDPYQDLSVVAFLTKNGSCFPLFCQELGENSVGNTTARDSCLDLLGV